MIKRSEILSKQNMRMKAVLKRIMKVYKETTDAHKMAKGVLGGGCD